MKFSYKCCQNFLNKLSQQFFLNLSFVVFFIVGGVSVCSLLNFEIFSVWIGLGKIKGNKHRITCVGIRSVQLFKRVGSSVRSFFFLQYGSLHLELRFGDYSSRWGPKPG